MKVCVSGKYSQSEWNSFEYNSRLEWVFHLWKVWVVTFEMAMVWSEFGWGKSGEYARERERAQRRGGVRSDIVRGRGGKTFWRSGRIGAGGWVPILGGRSRESGGSMSV